uniref:Reverse transcriptase domain-containing protein n=1 Tax=Latimeria chalumnae TaxID=7897 RepID=H3A382_LATCH
KFNTDLQDPSIWERYAVEVKNHFEALDLETQHVESGKKMKICLVESAEKTIERVKRCKRKPWISDEVLLLAEKKAKLRKKRHVSEELYEEYKRLKREVQRKCRRDKEEWIAEQCKELEEAHQKGNTWKLFQKLRSLSKKPRMNQSSIKDANGLVLTETQDTKEYLINLFKKLVGKQVTEALTLDKEELEPEPIIREVQNVIVQLKCRKAPGVDEIPAELLKASGEFGVSMFHQLCCRIWKSVQWPEEWFLKGGDSTDCNNYRTISLISHASKVLLTIIVNCLKNKIVWELPESQAGSQAGRGTRDMLVNLQLLIEKILDVNSEGIVIFIDYTKAFDSASHPQLFSVLITMGFPKHLVALLQSMYSKQQACVCWNNERSDWFPIEKRVRQGCIASPGPFNIYSEQIVREAEVEQTGVVIFATQMDSDVAETQQKLDRVADASARRCIQINAKNPKDMLIAKAQREIVIRARQEWIEQVESFRYPSSQKTNNGDCTKEINSRIAMAKAKTQELDPIWKDFHISKRTKIYLLKSTVWSVLLYGVESWILKVVHERRIRSTEMSWLRGILRVSRLQKIKNEVIRKQLGQEITLLQKIQERRLQRFGHISRMDPERIPHMAIHTKVQGMKNRGRPRIHWIDTVKNDIQQKGLKMNKAVKLVQDRKFGRILLTSGLASIQETTYRL